MTGFTKVRPVCIVTLDPGGNQLGPSRLEGLEAISRSAQPGDYRAPFPGTMLGSGTRESSSFPGTPARSSWLTHCTGRNSEPLKSWQRKRMLTLEGIYRPQIPREAPCLHEPSAVFNLQLLVLPGSSSSRWRGTTIYSLQSIFTSMTSLNDTLAWCLLTATSYNWGNGGSEREVDLGLVARLKGRSESENMWSGSRSR